MSGPCPPFGSSAGTTEAESFANIPVRSVDYPKTIRAVQGLAFISRGLDLWTHRYGATLDFSRPVKPTVNAFIEVFNARLKAECMNAD